MRLHTPRALHKGRIAGAALAGLCLIPPAQAQEQGQLGFYGTPGLLDMPVADSLPDATLAFSNLFTGRHTRSTLAFQLTPRLTAAFRYASFDLNDDPTYYDRSFDLHFRLLDEGTYLPALAVGLRDFGGTGKYNSEYIVASRQLSTTLRASAGIGWGRLASHGGFSNPLSFLGDRFRTRPAPDTGVGGTFRADAWFRGDAALFGGLQWRPTERLTLSAEYSSDAYRYETAQGVIEHKSPVNVGVTYRASDHWILGGHYLYGSTLGVTATLTLNPRQPTASGDRTPAPIPVMPRVAGQSADPGWSGDTVRQERIRTGLARLLEADGLALESLTLAPDTATLRLRNLRHDSSAQAIGRAARAMTVALPASVETFVIVPVVQGIPAAAVRLERADIEALEHHPDGANLSWLAADISAPAGRPAAADYDAGLYPKFLWSLGPYARSSLFDPDNPFRADLGAEARASYNLAPGLFLSGALNKRLVGNLDQVTRMSDSVLPHVRSDFGLYDKYGDPALSQLTAEYFFRPAPQFYGRLSAGYLERMFGGVSGEVLWKPVDSRLGLGIEVNYARQRTYDHMFRFQDYDVVTGHVSGYYAFDNGFHLQIDAGRYLAGDYGTTVTLDREFNNGWRVGGFVTLTDVRFEDFGEGSFDKGIRLSIPVSWFLGTAHRSSLHTTIRPLTRDGGARLNVSNRLYELVRDYHRPELQNQWGQFWR